MYMSLVEPARDQVIKIPYLTPREKMSLARGERVQKQERNGVRGSGLVVLDVEAPVDEVFDTLTKFSMYQEMIPTVRSSNILSETTSNGEDNNVNTVAEFTLSRFKLKVNVVHRVYRKQRTVRFSLDNSRPNLVFNEAEGFWHVQEPSDRPEGWSRVYLKANIVATMLLPPPVLDYAASRALPRATKWIVPYFTSSSKTVNFVEDHY